MLLNKETKPTRLDLTQGHYNVGEGLSDFPQSQIWHETILLCMVVACTNRDPCLAVTKNAWPPRYTSLEVPRTPSNKICLAQLAEALEYTDCITVEE